MKKTLASSLLVGVLLLGMSGCLSSPSSSAPPMHAGTAADPAPATIVRGTGSIAASGPALAVGGASIPFTVTSNVTLLFAEIAWDDPVQDIDLALASPEAGMTGTAQNFDYVATGGMPGAPDSPHSLTIPSPTAGDWQASAFANGAAAMVDYRIVVTLFHGEATVPAGYSALE